MSLHTLFIPDFDADPLHEVGSDLQLTGEEAKHALRVKRVRTGEAVRVLNGRGVIASGSVTSGGKELGLRIEHIERVERVTPEVEVWAAPPKGPRAGELVDMLSQVGAAAWTPMTTTYAGSSASHGKLDRLERIAIESSKQCGRAWLLRIDRAAPLKRGLEDARGARLILADAAGEDALDDALVGMDGVNASVRLFIGPEGGWTDEERAMARRAGAKVVRFGPHVMRIEAAAPVATAVILQRCAARAAR